MHPGNVEEVITKESIQEAVQRIVDNIALSSVPSFLHPDSPERRRGKSIVGAIQREAAQGEVK